MNLRLGYPKDFDVFREMVVKFAKVSPYKDFPIADHKVDNIVKELLEADKNEKIVIFALDRNDHPIGVVAALKLQPLFTDDYLATEMIWWVNDEHRHSRISIELYNAYEHWAKLVGCKYIQMSALETNQIEQIDAFYKRKGYAPTERGYIKEI